MTLTICCVRPERCPSTTASSAQRPSGTRCAGSDPCRTAWAHHLSGVAVPPGPEPLNEREKPLAAIYGMRQAVRARGCEAYGMTGYRGRLPVLEVSVLTPEVSELIQCGAPVRQLADAARAAGMRSMRDVAAEWDAPG